MGRATKLVVGMRNLVYNERLRRLGIITLSKRGLRGDLIQTHKMISGKNWKGKYEVRVILQHYNHSTLRWLSRVRKLGISKPSEYVFEQLLNLPMIPSEYVRCSFGSAIPVTSANSKVDLM